MKKFLSLLLIFAIASMGMWALAEEEPLKLDGMIILYDQAPAKDSDFWKWMEETFNVDYNVEWVPGASYDDKLSLMLNTDDLPDIVRLNSTSSAIVTNAANEGMFYDLTDLLDFEKYPNLGKINPGAWTVSKINGRNYVLPHTRGQYNLCLFLRGDLLEELGMEKPTTISQYTDFMRAVKEKHPDMIPLAYEMYFLEDFFLGAFGEGQILPAFTEDGEGIVHYALTESYAKFVEWLKQLYDEGLLASEFALYNSDKNNDLFVAGLTPIRYQNLWHRYRLENEGKKVDENAYLVPSFYVTSDDGKYVALEYDMGAYGGLALNADLDEEKVVKILEFMDKTAAPDYYNTFRYGIEGVHWTMVDGFPVATEQGAAEITNSLFGPFEIATNIYDKVNSPLADAAYNLESQEMAKEVDVAAEMVGAAPYHLFSIIKSNSWSQFWSTAETDFDAYVADTITGQHTVDEFRAYQQSLLEKDEVKASFQEFKASYDEFGLANW